MRIYLIRHGETEYNRRQLLQGYSEVPLNDLGIAQASRAAKRMAEVRLDHIYSSDLRRTTMTAAIIAAATGTAITYDEGLRERNPGDLTHKTYAEGIRFFTDPEFDTPGGESHQVFEQRVDEHFHRVIERDGDSDRHIALVTHGMVCRSFINTHLSEHAEAMAEASWPNTCVSILDYNGSWNVVTLGDASHLEGLEEHTPKLGVGG